MIDSLASRRLMRYRCQDRGEGSCTDGRKGREGRGGEICITRSNIKRPPWLDDVDVRRKIPASRHLSHCFATSLFSSHISRSLSPSFSLLSYPLRSGAFFSSHRSLPALFGPGFLLSFSLSFCNVSRFVASSKGLCRAQKYLRARDGAAPKSIREPASY